MSMSKLSANLAVISALADNPSETAAQLKAKFDQAGLAIGAYLNGTLTAQNVAPHGLKMTITIPFT